MSKTSLGRVSLVPKGAYNAVTAYERLDVVAYEGAGYIVLRDVQGVTPADGEDYMLLAESLPGPKGDPGATPELSVGTVTTLEPGSEAKASFTGTAEKPVLNLELPRGASGGVDVANAEVGQTIIVKAVDENGKPTEWEAADMPSGGSGGSAEYIPYAILADDSVTIEEGVTSFEIDLDETDKYTDFAFHFILSTSTLTTECSGLVNMYIDGYRVGYYLFSGQELLTAALYACGYGDIISQIVTSVVATAKVSTNNFHSRMQKGFGNSRKSSYVRKVVWEFPAEYAGTITYQIYAR